MAKRGCTSWSLTYNGTPQNHIKNKKPRCTLVLKDFQDVVSEKKSRYRIV